MRKVLFTENLFQGCGMITARALLVVLLLGPVGSSSSAGSFRTDDDLPLSYKLATAQQMWSDISGDVRKHYYDPKFHGVDWDAKVHETKDAIAKSSSMNMAMGQIAAALHSLNDSHTFFLPPPRPYRIDYGWQMEMIGSHCYISHVRPGSDAEAKGIKPGDEIIDINGHAPTRENLWILDYALKVLHPETSLQLNLRAPNGSGKRLDVAAKTRDIARVRDATRADDIWMMYHEAEGKELRLHSRWKEASDKVLVVSYPTFEGSLDEIDDIIGRVRKYDALVLDLRGNPGGSIETLKAFLGGMFDHEIKVYDRVGRGERKPLVAKFSRHFDGKLTVLVDSQSASAAELFARTVQIEKRGMILGDLSSGSVMESKQYSYQTGQVSAVFFGASITDADLIMKDGNSLEHVGVSPDERILPSASDLAEGRDVALARAVELSGATISPEQAGKLFPYSWPEN
jgi:C-terminal processing protease CtpA/Prc